MKKTIHVGWKEIQDGVRGDTGECPVALGIARVFKDKKVSVGCEQADVNGLICDLPTDVRQFIDDFDEERGVKPFKIRLEFTSKHG